MVPAGIATVIHRPQAKQIRDIYCYTCLQGKKESFVRWKRAKRYQGFEEEQVANSLSYLILSKRVERNFQMNDAVRHDTGARMPVGSKRTRPTLPSTSARQLT